MGTIRLITWPSTPPTTGDRAVSAVVATTMRESSTTSPSTTCPDRRRDGSTISVRTGITSDPTEARIRARRIRTIGIRTSSTPTARVGGGTRAAPWTLPVAISTISTTSPEAASRPVDDFDPAAWEEGASGASLRSTAATSSTASPTGDRSTPSQPWNSTSRRGTDGTYPSPSRASTTTSTTMTLNFPNRSTGRTSWPITSCTSPTVSPTRFTTWWTNCRWDGPRTVAGGTRPPRRPSSSADRASLKSPGDDLPPLASAPCGTSKTNSDRCPSRAAVPSSRSIPTPT
mmetsp:Transcript_22296/g.46637  ORF Transcript_22296/g.46637 Transcript_22296/m.46637 type:complete len:287 (+) Transcript_22296:526-1386(+)